MNTTDHFEFLARQLADCETDWSVGTFGAIAEFTRDPGEATSGSDLSVVTKRGGIRLTPVPALTFVASESPTRESWNHRVALCLPETESGMSRRTVLTELGPDNQALREADRDGILFDLGLGAVQVDACIRVADPEVAAALRKCAGRDVFEHGNPAMSIIVPAGPHRVFISRVGRVEVFQPIPPPDGRSPNGPHTHVLPKLLQHGRTHAATENIPSGLVPCAHFYPAHPAKDSLGRVRPFDAARHAAFQRLLDRFGDREIIQLKSKVASAVEQGSPPSELAIPNERFARANVRVTLRQLQASHQTSPVLAAWREAHDRVPPEAADSDEEMAAHS